MKTIFAALFTITFLVANVGNAQQTSGQADLDAVVALWLSGNDRDSLPQLADLARAGNADARILLGRIEILDRGPSPFRLSLSPDEHRTLFRSAQDAGNFARTWLAVEADTGNPLAIALLNSRMSRVDPDLIKTLQELGEVEASDHPTRILALYGSQKIKQELLASQYLLPDLRPYLEYLTDEPEQRGDGMAALRLIAASQNATVPPDDPDALAMAGALALGYGFGGTEPGNKWRQSVSEWLLNTPSARPIAGLCNAECPAEVSKCAFAMMTLTGGYFETIRLDTPVEAVIAQPRFLASPRARLMTLRRAALARRETNAELASIAQIAELSSCTAGLIEAERNKYR